MSSPESSRFPLSHLPRERRQPGQLFRLVYPRESWPRGVTVKILIQGQNVIHTHSTKPLFQCLLTENMCSDQRFQ